MSLFRYFWIECQKVNWLVILLLMLVGTAVPILANMGAPDYPNFVNAPDWYIAYLMMTQFYASLFLPVVAAVLTALLCRVEHQGDTWKQILLMPISRFQLYGAKFLLAFSFVALMQTIYVGGIVLVGTGLGYEGEIPWNMIVTSILQGWIALLPIVALQLWASFLWKSFAGALAVNIVCAIPALLVAHSELLGPWYIWAYPILAMMKVEHSWIDTNNTALLIRICSLFLLFFVGGSLHFARKEW